MTNNQEPVDLEAMIADYLVERFDLPRERLGSDATLREIGLDSMVMLDVMLDVEDRLGVKLRDLTMPPNPKLGDIVALIQRNLDAGK